MEKKPIYWGEVPKETMENILRDAVSMGWKSALLKSLECDASTKEYLLSPERHYWIYLSNLLPGAKVLDLASGLGFLSFFLCGLGLNVTSLDIVKDRIDFINIRKSQENAQNLEAIHSDALGLPFKDNYFDSVVSIGLLHRIIGSGKNWRARQEKVLRESHRVLKDGASLYLAVENKYSPVFFLKKRVYAKALYSMGGYRRLLENSGFKNIRFYAAIPSYRNFKAIIPLDNAQVPSFFLKSFITYRYLRANRIIRFFSRFLPLHLGLKYFSFDYFISAQK